jgi:hypothetical protein
MLRSQVQGPNLRPTKKYPLSITLKVGIRCYIQSSFLAKDFSCDSPVTYGFETCGVKSEVRLRHLNMMNEEGKALDYELIPYISRDFVSPLQFSKRAISHGSHTLTQDVEAIGFNVGRSDCSLALVSHATFNGGVHPKDLNLHCWPSSHKPPL